MSIQSSVSCRGPSSLELLRGLNLPAATRRDAPCRAGDDAGAPASAMPTPYRLVAVESACTGPIAASAPASSDLETTPSLG